MCGIEKTTKKLLALVAIIALSGCAGSQYKQDMAIAESRLSKLSKYELRDLSLAPSGHPNEDTAIQECGAPFIIARQRILEDMVEELDNDPSSYSHMLRASRTMKKAEGWLDNCAKNYGLSMWAAMISPGSEEDITTSSWIRQRRSAMLNYRISHNLLREHNEKIQGLTTAIGIGLMSGSANYGKHSSYNHVDPYVRDNGDFVEGHFRSNPNEYCSDNLNGCR